MKRAFLVVSVAALLAPAAAGAVTLKPGDILVADANGYGGNGGITLVDANTGAQQTVASGGFFNFPNGVTVDPDGQILVADGGAFGGAGCNPGGCGGVIKVDPATGAQTPVTQLGSFVNPSDLVID